MLLHLESTAFYCLWVHKKASFIKYLDQDSALEYPLALPQECVPGKCSAILSPRRICWGAFTSHKLWFLHQSCASEQKAKTALTERNRQQSKHRFQHFIRKNYFKRFLWSAFPSVLCYRKCFWCHFLPVSSSELFLLAQRGIVRPANRENPKIKMFLEEFISVYCIEKFHTMNA